MQPNTYHVRTLPAGCGHSAIEWAAIPAAEISHYAWLEGYAPHATAQLVYIEGTGFLLRMVCRETAPQATYSSYMDPVYNDSCMEFFADWLSDGRYINMEMNANGALLSCIGPDRHRRVPIADLTGGKIFPVAAEIGADSWSVTAEIPLSLLSDILGAPVAVTSGFSFGANFYKCGDETACPHYGMWNPVGTPSPDFHAPAFFGRVIVD